MAAVKRKIRRFVIDVNTYVTIFINQETEWLLQYIAKNRIEIFIDSHLLNELARVLEYPKIKRLLPLGPALYLNFVRIISTEVVASPFGVSSPDPMDDYLFDLALSTHAKLLVTGDKALLEWTNAPVETISLPSFKKMF